MYGFHKIKNDKGVHEFRHPHFRKGNYDDLVNIKRKNFINQKGEENNEKDLNVDEYNQLKETLERTKASLETLTQQNINLISANKEVAGKLYNFKHDYESRLKKLFFMFYFLINSKDEKLLNLLKKTLIELGVAFDGNKNKNYEEQTSEVIEHINRKILASNNSEQIIISKLLNTFTDYVTSAGYFSDEVNLKSFEMKMGEHQNKNESDGFEFQYINSPRKSIQSLNVNVKSEAVSECDFSGQNSVLLQKSPVPQFDMYDNTNKTGDFDLERLMIPLAGSNGQMENKSSNTPQSFRKKPFYEI